jgi:hypothetical protein
MGTPATAGADLDALMASFNSRIKEIGNLWLVRNGGFWVLGCSGIRIDYGFNCIGVWVQSTSRLIEVGR